MINVDECLTNDVSSLIDSYFIFKVFCIGQTNKADYKLSWLALYMDLP
jgi:hypothetical protein